MAEKRLIDANKLEEKAIYITGPKGSACHAVPLGLIQAAPTIDPETLRPMAHWDGQYDGYYDGEPVVRCKDCEHFKNYGKTSLLADGKNIKAGWCYRRIR